jgi:hypothetical protein
MEQGLIDQAKYNISLHSIDSRFSDLKNSMNSEFRVQNPIAIKNIMRVRLASIEVPLVEPMFSVQRGNVSMLVRIGAAPNFTNTGNIVTGNYTAAALVASIQALLQNIHSGFTCTLSPISGLLTIKNTSVAFTFDFASTNATIGARPTHWGLGYYLGFRSSLIDSAVDSNGINFITGISVINVQANPYYLLTLKCPDEVVNVTHRINNGTFLSAFAKIVLTDNYYQLQFDDNSNLMRKEYTFLSPVNIPFFQLSLIDPWGDLVNMMDADWSVTIEVTEIKSSKIYAKLLDVYK